MSPLSHYITTLFESNPQERFDGKFRLKLIESHPEYAERRNRGPVITDEANEQWLNCTIINYSRISALKMTVDIYPIYSGPNQENSHIEYWFFKDSLMHYNIGDSGVLIFSYPYGDEQFSLDISHCYQIYRKILLKGQFLRSIPNLDDIVDNNYNGDLERYNILMEFEENENLHNALSSYFKIEGDKIHELTGGVRFPEWENLVDDLFETPGLIFIDYISSSLQRGNARVDENFVEFGYNGRVDFNNEDIIIGKVCLQKNFGLLSSVIYTSDFRNGNTQETITIFCNHRVDGEDLFPMCDNIVLRYSREENIIDVEFNRDNLQPYNPYIGRAELNCSFTDIRTSHTIRTIFGNLFLTNDTGDYIRNDCYSIALILDTKAMFDLDEHEIIDSLNRHDNWVIADTYADYFEYFNGNL